MPIEIIHTTLEHLREKIYIVYHRYDKDKPVEYRTYYRTPVIVFEYYEKLGGRKEDFGEIVFPPLRQRMSFPPKSTSKFHLVGRSYEFTLVHEEGQDPQPEIVDEVFPLYAPEDGKNYYWERGKWVAA